MNLRLLAAALALSFIACSGKTEESTAPADTAAASAPAAAQGAGANTFAMPTNLQTTPSGLQYAIDQPGRPQAAGGSDGDRPLHRLADNGTKFDSSRTQAASRSRSGSDGRGHQGLG